MNMTITPLHEDRIPEVVANMCDADRLELQRLGAESPEVAIRDSIKFSGDVRMIHWGGQARSVFGVSRYMGDEFPPECVPGIPWLVGDYPPLSIHKEFIRASVKVIEGWAEEYDVLFNVVDADHWRALRWLSFLGFKPMRLNHINQYPFIEMVKLCAS